MWDPPCCYIFGAPKNHVDLSYLSTENPNNHKLMNWMNSKDDNKDHNYTICFNFPPLTHCVALWTGDLQNSYTLFKVQPTWIHSLFQAAYISFMLPFFTCGCYKISRRFILIFGHLGHDFPPNKLCFTGFQSCIVCLDLIPPSFRSDPPWLAGLWQSTDVGHAWPSAAFATYY